VTEPRRGTSLVETLVAMALGIFILHMGMTTMARLRAFGQRATVVHDEMLGARIGRTVLREELRRGVPGRDRWADSDSIVLRAFRGAGLVCATDTTRSAVTVAYSGPRLPDPRKDSVEWMAADGSVGVADLAAIETLEVGCPPELSSARNLRMTLDGFWPAGVVAIRVFERGSYHLTGSALRYRTGLGGRQPISPEVWRDTASQLRIGELAIGYTLSPASGSPPWTGFLDWSHRRPDASP
jgi:hypothetical protein